MAFASEKEQRLALEKLRGWGQWEEFRARNLNHELVLVSIELAQALVRRGEPARAAELVAEIHPIMKGWGMHKDALAAWAIFQEALAQGAAAADLFARVSDYYRRHWFIPAKFGQRVS
jgi:hypothetical protein